MRQVLKSKVRRSEVVRIWSATERSGRVITCTRWDATARWADVSERVRICWVEQWVGRTGCEPASATSERVEEHPAAAAGLQVRAAVIEPAVLPDSVCGALTQVRHRHALVSQWVCACALDLRRLDFRQQTQRREQVAIDARTQSHWISYLEAGRARVAGGGRRVCCCRFRRARLTEWVRDRCYPFANVQLASRELLFDFLIIGCSLTKEGVISIIFTCDNYLYISDICMVH